MVHRVALFLLASGLFAALPDSVQAQPDTLRVRLDCQGVTVPNCFQGYYGIMNAVNWAATQSSAPPDQDPPRLIDVGPGHFSAFGCGGLGNATIRGTGRESQGSPYTKVETAIFPVTTALFGDNCQHVTFQNMTIGEPSARYAVIWKARGDTVWEEVDFVGDWSWYDGCGGDAQALHYFFDSVADANPIEPAGMKVGCSEIWWYGGAIDAIADPLRPHVGTEPAQGVLVSGNGDLRVFGTDIVVDTDWGSLPPENAPSQVIGVRVSSSEGGDQVAGEPFPTGDGVFHLHGGSLVVDASPLDGADVIGLQVVEEGTAHTPGAGFDLTPASPPGARVRVERADDAHVHSPFSWPAGALPPLATSEASVLGSVHGYDDFTETDCSAQGDCSGGGSQSHRMVYSPGSCTDPANPWLDVTTGRCRNDTTP